MRIKISDLKQIIREELGRNSLLEHDTIWDAAIDSAPPFDNACIEDENGICMSGPGGEPCDDCKAFDLSQSAFASNPEAGHAAWDEHDIDDTLEDLHMSREPQERPNQRRGNRDPTYENKKFDRGALLKEMDETTDPFCNIGEDPFDPGACTGGLEGKPCSTCASYERGVDVSGVGAESPHGIGRRDPSMTSQLEPRKGRDRRIPWNTPSGRRGIR